MAQASLNEVEKDKEFFVKDIPEHFTDWNVFHAFRVYGEVHNVRIPFSQQSCSKYGFVTMLTHAGAEQVRKNISKRKLAVSPTVSLMVSDVRSGAERTAPKKSEQRVLAPITNNGGSPLIRYKSTDKCKDASSSSSKVVFRDLPIGKSVIGKVVASPFPPAAGEFSFHAVQSSYLPDDYEVLQNFMNNYCNTNPPLKSEETKIGDFLLVAFNSSICRAQRISQSHVYLVDLGEVVNFNNSKSWPLPEKCTFLPALVIACTFADLKWIKSSSAELSIARDTLHSWSNNDSSISLTNTGFKGALNVVRMETKADRLSIANSLILRGFCKQEQQSSIFTYSRDKMLSLKKQAQFPQDDFGISENLKDIYISEKN